VASSHWPGVALQWFLVLLFCLALLAPVSARRADKDLIVKSGRDCLIGPAAMATEANQINPKILTRSAVNFG
jgi:hypothetical protein